MDRTARTLDQVPGPLRGARDNRLVAVPEAILQRVAVEPAIRMELLVIATAAVFSMLGFLYFYAQGMTLLYGDAASHLNMARRVVDNVKPGLIHLGAIWLPLPHVAMLPFVWNDFLFRTGLAGSMVSMAAYIVSATFLYRSVVETTRDRWAGVVGALVLMLCPSLMYLQSTPMTESLMICMSVLATYFLIVWCRTGRTGYLYATGITTLLATLTRYDGWFLVVTIGLCVGLVSYFRRGDRAAEGSALTFLAPAIYGIFLWLLYNWMFFGDPLNFSRGLGSASWYALQYAESGELSPKGNLPVAFGLYGWAMIDVVGVVFVLLLAIGVIWYAFRYRVNPAYAGGYVFLSLIAFNIISLFLGQSILVSKHFSTGDTNIRYALMALPAAAFFAGTLAAGSAIRKALIVIAVFFQIGLFLPVQSMAVISDPAMVEGEWVKEANAVATLIHNEYDGKMILVGTLRNDQLVFKLGVPLKEIIYEGSGPYWTRSMVEPHVYAGWVIMNLESGDDRVTLALANNQDLQDHFDLVYSSQRFRIYRNRWDAEPTP